jgi:Tfp pilus assembly protein PilF
LILHDAWAHNYLGQILNQLDQYDEAEKELRAAIEIYYDLPLFHCNLGDVLARQHRWREAEEEYKRALALDVNYYLANLRYGQLLERMSYRAKARIYAERAQAAKPWRSPSDGIA